MQISGSTLLASQQAATAQAKPAPGFAAALEQSEGFSPLPLKQTAAASEAPPMPKATARLGSQIDIKV